MCHLSQNMKEERASFATSDRRSSRATILRPTCAWQVKPDFRAPGTGLGVFLHLVSIRPWGRIPCKSHFKDEKTSTAGGCPVCQNCKWWAWARTQSSPELGVCAHQAQSWSWRLSWRSERRGCGNSKGKAAVMERAWKYPRIQIFNFAKTNWSFSYRRISLISPGIEFQCLSTSDFSHFVFTLDLINKMKCNSIWTLPFPTQWWPAGFTQSPWRKGMGKTK